MRSPSASLDPQPYEFSTSYSRSHLALQIRYRTIDRFFFWLVGILGVLSIAAFAFGFAALRLLSAQRRH